MKENIKELVLDIKGINKEYFNDEGFQITLKDKVVLYDGTPIALYIGNGFIFNADNEYIGDLFIEKITCPTVSFNCLVKLLKPSIRPNSSYISPKVITKVLNNTDFSFMELTENRYKDLTPQEKKSLKPNNNGVYARKNGYSIVYLNDVRIWHKPSEALIKSGGKYFLIGSDEGSYFGCELAKNVKPKNLEEAYKSLRPPELAKHKDSKIRRQGEWFIIKLREFNKSETLTRPNFSIINLPKERQESNDHTIEDGYIVGYDEDNNQFNFIDIGVSSSRTYLYTTDHESIELCCNKVYRFVRNTAARSVSQEGVD